MRGKSVLVWQALSAGVGRKKQMFLPGEMELRASRMQGPGFTMGWQRVHGDQRVAPPLLSGSYRSLPNPRE